ncbi:hypothetical protein [Variovorax sp. JS1663]|uniref:hypothetical protein n=1 Tax=Variovorax sp. JS1663 TaxID=1851577 RepID=UPI000B344368|nr:hypothetical protein [Variovorax sp. JS1663]OUM04180.1 hypothetical protein A8M77_00215 [Variovorax sp. JS1663]
MRASRSLGAIAMAALAMGVSLQACAHNTKPARDISSQKMTTAPMKPGGSGIAVQYRIDGTPESGSAVPVVLSFDGITDPAGGTVKLRPDGGLAITGSSGPYTLPAGRTSTLTVQVVPDADGIGYLHVFTTQNGATSATSITVQVGKEPSTLPASSGLKQTPGGDKILSMPVK